MDSDTNLYQTIEKDCSSQSDDEAIEDDPIHDIVDYLITCAKVSLANAYVNQKELRTSEKIRLACEFYKKDPVSFLQRYGKYLAPYHVGYFAEVAPPCSNSDAPRYNECVRKLQEYHSDTNRHKRTKNRRYRALQKLQTDSDYFSEKQMMYRNPLLYEQLVGQYLSDEEIKERDGIDSENLTFLNMILETVDRNRMREIKNVQKLEEEGELKEDNVSCNKKPESHWGDFSVPDIRNSFKPEVRKQALISAPERRLLRQEFLQEMFTSFLEGRDNEIDYQNIDDNEEYDDLVQVARDEEDKYFDSEGNDTDNLEEHMNLVTEYGATNCIKSDNDPLDEYMEHLGKKLKKS